MMTTTNSTGATMNDGTDAAQWSAFLDQCEREAAEMAQADRDQLASLKADLAAELAR